MLRNVKPAGCVGVTLVPSAIRKAWLMRGFLASPSPSGPSGSVAPAITDATRRDGSFFWAKVLNRWKLYSSARLTKLFLPSWYV